jgi:hypothetical protein
VSPAQAGEYDRCLGLLYERGILSRVDFTILNRMFWALRSRDSDQTQATLDLIARKAKCCRDAVIHTTRWARELGILEKRAMMVRRVVDGVRRWVNGANIYVFKIPEELPEPEVVIAVVRLPQPGAEIVSESAGATTNLKVRKKASYLTALKSLDPREEQEDAHGKESVSADSALAGADPGGAGSPAGGERRPAAPVAVEPGRSQADGMGGGVPDRDGADTAEIPGEGPADAEAVGPDPVNPGKAGYGRGRDGGDGDGRLSDADLLEARRKALEARSVESGKVPRQTLRPPLDPLAARAKAIRDRLAEVYRQRRLERGGG